MLGFESLYASLNKTKEIAVSATALKEENNFFKNLTRKTFGSLSEWSTFEKSWLLLFTAINLAVFFIFGTDSFLGLIASLSGILCVVLVAKGKISNYFFGLVQVLIYGYISMQFSLYGEAMLNFLFYTPLQFIGFYLWYRNAKNNSKEGTTALTETTAGSSPSSSFKITVKKLSWKGLLGLTLVSGLAIWAYALLLQALSGASVGLDSATTVLSIVAQFLMLARYAEQWLLWIIVNILSIALWGLTLTGSQATGEDPAWNVLIMWVAFLFNSIYGYINWLKISKKQEAQALEGAE